MEFDNRYRYLCCVFGLLVSLSEAQYRLSVDVKPQSVMEGNTLTVTCKVNKTSGSASEVEIVWVRRMAGERELEVGGKLEMKEIEIGRNATILEDFKRSGRFSASQGYLDYHQTYTLVISGLKSTDSGEIGCRLLNNHIEIFKPVVVHKIPSKVSLMSKNIGNDQATSYQDKEKVEFTEMEKRNFQCFVREVYPEPRVRVLLGKVDVTDRFNKSLRLTRTLANEDIVNIGELSSLHYDVIMTSFGLEFSYEFDNNSISCVSDFPGSGFSSSSASVQVSLKGYTPKFICNHDYPVSLHHSNFELQCKILGHPKASSAKIQWKRHTTGNMTLLAGQKFGSYEAQLSDSQKFDARAKILTFRIDHIFPQHFRQYNLEATNAIGSSTFAVNVYQVGKPRVVSSGAVIHFSTSFHLAIIITWCSNMAVVIISR